MIQSALRLYIPQKTYCMGSAHHFDIFSVAHTTHYESKYGQTLNSQSSSSEPAEEQTIDQMYVEFH